MTKEEGVTRALLDWVGWWGDGGGARVRWWLVEWVPGGLAVAGAAAESPDRSRGEDEESSGADGKDGGVPWRGWR